MVSPVVVSVRRVGSVRRDRAIDPPMRAVDVAEQHRHAEELHARA